MSCRTSSKLSEGKNNAQASRLVRAYDAEELQAFQTLCGQLRVPTNFTERRQVVLNVLLRALTLLDKVIRIVLGDDYRQVLHRNGRVGRKEHARGLGQRGYCAT
jgi:hypothetical protein